MQLKAKYQSDDKNGHQNKNGGNLWIDSQSNTLESQIRNYMPD